MSVRSAEQDTSDVNSSSTSEGQSQAPQPQAMGHKNDLIVWLQLHPAQRHIYEVNFMLAKSGLSFCLQTRLDTLVIRSTLLFASVSKFATL